MLTFLVHTVYMANITPLFQGKLSVEVCDDCACTVFPLLNAWAFISFSKGAYQAFTRDWRLLETGVY